MARRSGLPHCSGLAHRSVRFTQTKNCICATVCFYLCVTSRSKTIALAACQWLLCWWCECAVSVVRGCVSVFVVRMCVYMNNNTTRNTGKWQKKTYDKNSLVHRALVAIIVVAYQKICLFVQIIIGANMKRTKYDRLGQSRAKLTSFIVAQMRIYRTTPKC